MIILSCRIQYSFSYLGFYSICLALRRVVVLRGGCLFTILLVLLKREEFQNYSSTSFALIELSQLI